MSFGSGGVVVSTTCPAGLGQQVGAADGGQPPRDAAVAVQGMEDDDDLRAKGPLPEGPPGQLNPTPLR